MDLLNSFISSEACMWLGIALTVLLGYIIIRWQFNDNDKRQSEYKLPSDYWWKGCD